MSPFIENLSNNLQQNIGTGWYFRYLLSAIILLLFLTPESTWAHVQAGTVGDGKFISGLIHPVTGLDHLVAMVAVGLWGAILGPPAIWLLPIAFPLIMAFGAVLGIIGIPIPGIEIGIATSGIVLGALVATNTRLPIAIAIVLISIFAICHGHAHGTELPDFGVPLLYAGGFVISTGLLHLCGITLGVLIRWPAGLVFVRMLGVLILTIGAYYLYAATTEMNLLT